MNGYPRIDEVRHDWAGQARCRRCNKVIPESSWVMVQVKGSKKKVKQYVSGARAWMVTIQIGLTEVVTVRYCINCAPTKRAIVPIVRVQFESPVYGEAAMKHEQRLIQNRMKVAHRVQRVYDAVCDFYQEHKIGPTLREVTHLSKMSQNNWNMARHYTKWLLEDRFLECDRNSDGRMVSCSLRPYGARWYVPSPMQIYQLTKHWQEERDPPRWSPETNAVDHTYRVIYEYYRTHGYGPTYREIIARTPGNPGVSTIRESIDKAHQAGMIHFRLGENGQVISRSFLPAGVYIEQINRLNYAAHLEQR